MKKFTWFLIYILVIQQVSVFSQANPPANIQIIPNAGPDEPINQALLESWVLDILHGGGGEIDTSSIEFIGNPQALGFFTGGTDFSQHCPQFTGDTCMDEGLIMSTGKVWDEGIFDPRNGKKSDVLNPYVPGYDALGDSSLLKMIKTLWQFGPFDPPQVGDLAVLQFNYKPYSEEIALKYMYASEEYPNANDGSDIDLSSGTDQHYDLLGIFIENPGYDPWNAVNQATLPDGDNPLKPPANWITLENVNAGSNTEFFLENNIPPVFGDDYSGYDVQYDGITKPILRAFRKLSKCRWYTVKIAIEDYLFVDPKNPEMKTFAHNSAVFLGKGGLSGGGKKPGWTVESNYTNGYPGFEGKLIDGGCNELELTYTLDSEANPLEPYYIGFKIEPEQHADKIEIIDITDPDTSFVIAIDSIGFNTSKRQTVKKIRLRAKDLTTNVNLVRFTYQEDPCDYLINHPNIPDEYSVKIPLSLIINEPISTVDNPTLTAYCKEEIQISKADMLSVVDGGVDPLTVRWPQGDLPFPDPYKYVVNSSPDLVKVRIDDHCNNFDTVYIDIINNAIDLNEISPLSFCKPGMSQEVEATWGANSDFPNYDFVSASTTWKNITDVPPTQLGSGNPFTINYDDDYTDSEWFAEFNVVDVCGNTAGDTFKVDQTGKLDVGGDKYICKGESVTLTNFTPVWEDDPINYKWYIKSSPTDSTIIGTGPSITVTPADTTTYYLYIYDACREEQVDALIVFVDHFLPQILVSPSTKEVCPGEEVTFTANEANSYLWTPGFYDTKEIKVTEYTAGVYTYTLTASSDYCIDKDTTASFEVFPQPTALFSFDPPANACTGETVQFTYGIDPNNVNPFQWDFGDGATSTQQNPSHIYNTPGTYNVKLHVQEYICEHDSTMPIVVDPLPAPNFTFNPADGCSPLTVDFSDASQDLIEPGATFTWEFGDGNTSNVKNPVNEYTEAGVYTVKLLVANTARCFAETVKPNIISVYPNPTADFEADPWLTTMDAPEIQFWNLSLSDSVLSVFDWEFGDEGTSSDENPTHTFLAPGEEIPVIFIIETTNGCPDTVVKYVGVTEFVRLFIPNAFTPNGDGVDDKFEIKGTPVTDWNLYIYDRWGKQIWSTHNFETQWDGNDLSGNPVPAGSYIFQITGTDYKLEPVTERGQVTVVR